MRWQVRGAGAVDGEPRACIRRSVERKRVAFGSSGSLGAAAAEKRPENSTKITAKPSQPELRGKKERTAEREEGGTTENTQARAEAYFLPLKLPFASGCALFMGICEALTQWKRSSIGADAV